MKRYKYPRTPHLLGSKGFTDDDIHITNFDQFEGNEVVITEKMDGEASSYYVDGYFHARSIDSRHHESRSYVINQLSCLGHKLKDFDNIRICGENCYAKHSIEYTDLEDYFLIYSVWNDEQCWDWVSVQAICRDLDLVTVPELYCGPFNKDILERTIKDLDLSKQEGIVIRNTKSFTLNEFDQNVAKWVRKGHVQTEDHWMSQKIIKNKLA